MKKMLGLIILFIFLIFSLLVVLSFALIKSIKINKVFPGETIAKELGFTPEVPPLDQISRFLEDDMEKTLVSQVCQQGGYDISGVVDKELFINSFSIKEFYQEDYAKAPKHPLRFVWMAPVGGAQGTPLTCAYIAIDFDKDDNPLAPGIFSVKEEYIRK